MDYNIDRYTISHFLQPDPENQSEQSNNNDISINYLFFYFLCHGFVIIYLLYNNDNVVKLSFIRKKSCRNLMERKKRKRKNVGTAVLFIRFRFNKIDYFPWSWL